MKPSLNLSTLEYNILIEIVDSYSDNEFLRNMSSNYGYEITFKGLWILNISKKYRNFKEDIDGTTLYYIIFQKLVDKGYVIKI